MSKTDVLLGEGAEEMIELARVDELVTQFAAELRRKLFEKVRQGERGWDDPAQLESYRDEMVRRAMNPYPGHEIDVANFAAFVWWTDQHSPDEGA